MISKRKKRKIIDAITERLRLDARSNERNGLRLCVADILDKCELISFEKQHLWLLLKRKVNRNVSKYMRLKYSWIR